MKFKELFGKATARWIKYSEYEAERIFDDNGDAQWYIMPAKDAMPSVYDPIESIEQIVVEALIIGQKFMSAEKGFYDSNRMIAEMCVFAKEYGLLGFMTGTPHHARIYGV